MDKKVKNQNKVKSVKELVKREYTEEEKESVTSYRKRTRRQAIKIGDIQSNSGKINLQFKGTDKVLNMAAFLEAFGTPDSGLQNYFLQQVIRTFRAINPSEELENDEMVAFFNHALAILHGIQPKDEIEGMLSVQMIGVHNMAMIFLAHAMNTQIINHKNVYINGGIKLLRIFTNQMEVLKKYRGGSQQKIVVEHVNINEGGQAIVGMVNRGEVGIDDKISG